MSVFKHRYLSINGLITRFLYSLLLSRKINCNYSGVRLRKSQRPIENRSACLLEENLTLKTYAETSEVF